MPDRRLPHRVLGIVDPHQHADERAALEVLAREPLAQHVEDDDQPVGGVRGPRHDLGLEPVARPYLLAPPQEGEDQLVLGAEVPVERHLRHPGAGHDRIDAHRMGAVATEQLVRGIEDPLARAGDLRGRRSHVGRRL
jgi:hypothetical protein